MTAATLIAEAIRLERRAGALEDGHPAEADRLLEEAFRRRLRAGQVYAEAVAQQDAEVTAARLAELTRAMAIRRRAGQHESVAEHTQAHVVDEAEREAD